MNAHLFEGAGVRDGPMHSQCMKPLGLGVQGLLGMRRVGVEVAGAGADRETACLALRRLGLGTKRVATRG